MGMRGTGVTAKAVVVAPLLAALLLTSAACAGDESAAPQPLSDSTSPTPTPSETATASESPSPTPTVKPLSRFEDEPPVRAAREWAQRYARAINRDERNFSSMAPVMTARGEQVLPRLGAEDFGLYYPGPIPFTPTGVQVTGRTARVVGCYWVEGFALDEEGGVPSKDRLIIPATLRFKKQGGEWKFDDFFDHDHTCNKVPVKGIGW